MKGAMIVLLGFGVSLALAACDDMKHQPRRDAYEEGSLFVDGQSRRGPPEGAIARDDPERQAALRTRPAMSAVLLHRGQERYRIYCVPCHDPAGTGHGTIVDRGFPQPPNFHDQRLRDASSDHFVDVITNGHGSMYSYAARVTPADRWAIAAYIRALQYSWNAPLDDLSDEERALVEASPK